MRILKIKGKDEQAIYDEIEREYGGEAVIINSHKERVRGIKGWFQKPTAIVTIAIDEDKNEEPEIKDEESRIIIEDQQIIQEVMKEVKQYQKQKQTIEDKFVGNAGLEESVSEITALKENLIKSLLNEGIAHDMVEYLMGEIKDISTIDEIARTLYIKITDCLKIERHDDNFKYIFFVGPTGVGKTTTIAKLTAEYVLNKHKKVTLFTADTYRIAAIEQLKTYAEIIDIPVEVIYEANDVEEYMTKWENQDYILIDTAGRSHKNITEVEKNQNIIKYVENKKVFLVVSLSTNYRDARNIIDLYKEVVGEFSIIFTKLDETDEIGNLLNIASYAKMPIAYITTGQDVPDDIEMFDTDAYIKQLLGRISYE